MKVPLAFLLIELAALAWFYNKEGVLSNFDERARATFWAATAFTVILHIITANSDVNVGNHAARKTLSSRTPASTTSGSWRKHDGYSPEQRSVVT